MNALVYIHCVCYNKSTSIVMSFFRPGVSPGLFLCYNVFKKVKKNMQWKEISMKFLLVVDYKEQKYSVVGTNQLKKTVTLQRVNGADKIFDVPISELTGDKERIAANEL